MSEAVADDRTDVGQNACMATACPVSASIKMDKCIPLRLSSLSNRKKVVLRRSSDNLTDVRSPLRSEVSSCSISSGKIPASAKLLNSFHTCVCRASISSGAIFTDSSCVTTVNLSGSSDQRVSSSMRSAKLNGLASSQLSVSFSV